MKNYKVSFHRTAFGERGEPLFGVLSGLLHHIGPDLPKLPVDTGEYQIRGLTRVGNVIQGTFAALRDDAPHVLGLDGQEREIDLDVESGERLIDKCHFQLRQRTDVLVWQINRAAGSIGKAEQYLSQLTERMVTLPVVVDAARLEAIMQGDVYEFEVAYDRPPMDDRQPRWNQAAFNLMNDAHAAHARFRFRADRGSVLGNTVKDLARRVAGGVGTTIKVRLTDEPDLIELTMAPVRDAIRVELVGAYPRAFDVFEGLEAAYDRQRDKIPPRQGH